MECTFGAGLIADYGDVDGEATACRTACALFDFSFVARARLAGPRAAAVLAGFATRPLVGLAAGRIGYALHARADGTLLSDLTVWALGDGAFEVMTGRVDDLTELAALAGSDCFSDLTAETAIFAVQGPDALRALDGLTDLARLARLEYFAFCSAEIAGVPCRVGRLGYSGERGFELVLPSDRARALWSRLAERARPGGFAAADRLRIEAGFALFAREFALPVTAAEAGLARFAAPGARPPALRLVCVRGTAADRPVLWRPPAAPERPRCPGHITVTSACWSPLAQDVLALGYVAASDAAPGAKLTDPSGTFHGLEVVALPFYDTDKRRPRGGWTPDDWTPAVDPGQHRS